MDHTENLRQFGLNWRINSGFVFCLFGFVMLGIISCSFLCLVVSIVKFRKQQVAEPAVINVVQQEVVDPGSHSLVAQ
ncbi:hypothetical protein [Pseudoalteromonas sp. MMG022]|uniref:hypothetical protein n=1 Tax=Pseudoalteromonas sp. MMG022 TaxID=2909978 RepID=UPI001F21F1DE|nr:hypothetical protein [Pseudoalteromonas sp. MMG022]MCF6435582.1 hypothetical protein [Pseudoalteromonas sp. MMG022]